MAERSPHDHGPSEVRARPDLQGKLQETAVFLGKNLRRLRAQRGLSQDAASEAASLHPKHLQRVESGKANVTLATLVALASAYEVELRDLFLKRPPKK